MSTKANPTTHLLARASECRCRNCPPDRVCAWGCVQGASIADIVIGAALFLQGAAAIPDPGIEPARQALWACYNAAYRL